MELQEILKPIKSDLDEVEKELHFLLRSESPSRIVNEISSHLLEKQGKRIRPALVILSAKALGYSGKRSILAAVAVELIHTATLIHDDVIDRSSLRRGLETVNSKWGDSLSVLMGDYIFSRVFSTLARYRQNSILYPLVEAAHKMSKGEILETENKRILATTEREYFSAIENKTASLFSAACRIGVSLGKGGLRYQRAFSSFGRNLGISFQIIDDLFDFISSEETLGKPVGSDVREGKITLPIIYALNRACPGEVEKIRKIMLSKNIQDGGFQKILLFIEANGGIAYAKKKALEYAAYARENLEILDDSESRRTLYSLVDFVVNRKF